MLPENAHARRAIWQAINPHTGKRRILETFVPELLASEPNETEMRLNMVNGSVVTFFGSDNYDRMVGASLAGIVSSEHALSHPSAYAFFSPMLQENGGWFAAISTPRGRNHFKDLFDYASKSPRWFAQSLSISDTGALTDEEAAEELEKYIGLYGGDQGEALFEQEYRVSFNAAIMGAYFAREMLAVRSEGRIDPDLEAVDAPVHTAWDLGVRDDTSIWFFQVVAGQLFILDCYSQSGAGVDHYAEMIASKRAEHGWAPGTDFVPHDARVKEWGSGRTRVETMQQLGLNPVVVPMASFMDGISAVRRTLPRCVFHARCEDMGIAALEQYRREWDDERKTFKATDVHDWCFTGDTKVLTRYGMHRMMDLPQNGEVLTRCGWTQYTNPRITRRAAPLVEVVFTDGLSVRCTPDHMFMTDSGWKSAESLQKGFKIQSGWTTSRSISWAACTAFTQARTISQKAARAFIGMFGRPRSAQSLAAATFTTETATAQTIQLKTSNVSTQKSTWKSPMQPAEREAKALSLGSLQGNALLNGDARQRAGSIADSKQYERKAGQNGNESLGRACSVALSSTASFARMGISRSFAAITARPLTIASVKHLEKHEDVWCITVPGQEEFSLSNGAVVHNCSHPAAAFRYLSMAWRTIRPEAIRDTIPDTWTSRAFRDRQSNGRIKV